MARSHFDKESIVSYLMPCYILSHDGRRVGRPKWRTSSQLIKGIEAYYQEPGLTREISWGLE